jgi:hypothetical protein
MKKVLALSLVFALFTISVSAQNEKQEKLRRHLVQQKLHNREMKLRSMGLMRQRQDVMRHQLMKQRVIRYKALNEARVRKMRMMPELQQRKMMLRRHYLHRRVI